jgi:hypothetical protein
MKKIIQVTVLCAGVMSMFSMCTPTPSAQVTETPATASAENYGGYESREKWGEHLVLIAGCHDCHSPKKMTDHGPDIDWDRALSGHPSNAPTPDVDRKDMESKGLAVTNDLTAWVGPWGVSYTANLTSDATGIGNWEEINFLTAIRKGKYKGIETGRGLLPPMPWQMYNNFSDEELKAIFAYLKSTKPINNVVPAPLPPVSAPVSI